jgi:hypothetical protein
MVLEVVCNNYHHMVSSRINYWLEDPDDLMMAPVFRQYAFFNCLCALV